MTQKGMKAQPPPPAPPGRRWILPFAGIIVVFVIVAGYHWYQRLAEPAADPSTASATTPASTAPPDDAPRSRPDAHETAAAATPPISAEPASAKFGPHTQDNYPP